MTVHVSYGYPSFVPIIGRAVPVFSRSSPAYHVNSSGAIAQVASGIPRFDWDPVPVIKTLRGILIEGWNSNVLLRSEEFDHSAWTKTNVTVTADNIFSPDGTLNADRLTCTSASSAWIRQQVAAIVDHQHSASVYVRQGSGATQANIFQFYNETTATTLYAGTINYSTGVMTKTGGNGSALAEPIGNFWWRVKIGAAIGEVHLNDVLSFYPCFNGQINANAQYAYAWRAQIEPFPFPSASSIKTIDVSVIRQGDALSINDISNFYNPLAGTFYTEHWHLDPSNTTSYGVASFDDTSVNNIIGMGTNASAVGLFEVNGGAPSTQVNSITPTAPSIVKIAGAWTQSEIAVSGNGATVSAYSTPVASAAMTRMRIGSASYWHNTSSPLLKVAYYAERLSNAELIMLSSGFTITKQPVLMFDFTATNPEIWGHEYA